MKKIFQLKSKFLILLVFIIVIGTVSCKNTPKETVTETESADSRQAGNATAKKEDQDKDYIKRMDAFKDSIDKSKWKIEASEDFDDHLYLEKKYFDNSGFLVKLETVEAGEGNKYHICKYYNSKKLVFKKVHLVYEPSQLSYYFYIRKIDFYSSNKLLDLEQREIIQLSVKEYYKDDSLYQSFIKLPKAKSYINQKFPLKEKDMYSLSAVLHKVFLYDNTILDIYLDGFSNESLSAINLKLLVGNEEELDYIPSSLYNLKKLGYLCLTNGNLTSFTYKSLPLKMLNLSKNKIHFFGGIENGDSLWLLNLSENELNKLDPSIKNLKNIEVLDLSGNQLTELPEEITYLDSLTYLFLENNMLTQFDFGNCNLKRLHLDNNRITKFPDYFPCPDKIKHLSLSGNEIVELGSGIGRFKNLVSLNLSNNQLTQLPPEIGELASLQKLILTNNQLTQLPDEICNLKNLNYIDISNNQLLKLPENIGNLSTLRNLDCSKNKLTSLPESLIELKKKKKLIIKES